MSEANGAGLATVVVVGEMSVKDMEQIVGQHARYTFVFSDGSISTMEKAREHLRKFLACQLWVLGQIRSFSLLALRDDAEHRGIDIEEKSLTQHAFA